MANPEHLKLLRQGVKIWNQWRAKNPEVCPDLREANLHSIDISGADLSGADLIDACLTDSNLEKANFTEANCGAAYLNAVYAKGAVFKYANLQEAYMRGSVFSQADFESAYLWGADLLSSKLQQANLIKAILVTANLSVADFEKADLTHANLCMATALGTNFLQAILTGVCIQSWNIDSRTNLDVEECQCIYFEHNGGYLGHAIGPHDFSNRRPNDPNVNFSSGEFAALFQQAVDTVDLIFKDGIDWQAFFQAFQDLRSQYDSQNLFIQAIEKKRNGAFVVRVEVPPEIDKAVIESHAKELYAFKVKALETQYEERLRLQGQHLEDARQTIEVERRDKASLMAVMATMASTQQGPKYDMRGAQFGGGFIETNYGTQYGGTINNSTLTTAETSSLSSLSSLTEATAEIQNLLTPLEASNPTATQSDQIAFLTLMIPSPQRERFISALRSSGGEGNADSEGSALQSAGSDGNDESNTALEAIPYGPLLKALVKSWQSPGSEE